MEKCDPIQNKLVFEITFIQHFIPFCRKIKKYRKNTSSNRYVKKTIRKS